MESLQRSTDELRRAKLDHAGAPLANELPKRPFGVFIEPTVELKIGRRKTEFSEEEKVTKDAVILRRDTAVETVILDSNEVLNNRHSRISVSDTLGLGGKLIENNDTNNILITRL